MNAEASLLSLEERHELQLLSLMYNHRTSLNVRRLHNRPTRNAERFTFYTERYNNLRYKNSPFYKGSELWNTLPLATIDSDSIFEFKKCLKTIPPKYGVSPNLISSDYIVLYYSL